MEDQIVARASADAAQEATLLSAVVYRSTARPGLSSAELGAMLSAARARNANEHLTGLLLYTGTHFFQWLEGPVDGVDHVWASIQRDHRHQDIELLGRPHLPVRLFRGWEMGLASTSRGIAEGIDDVVLVEDGFYEALDRAENSMGAILELLSHIAPPASVLSSAPSVDARTDHVRVLCLDHVLPLVQAQHGLAPAQPLRRSSRAPSQLPRIDPAFIERFADRLRAADYAASERLWQRLQGLGVSVEALCNDLVEPTARYLGDLWAEDHCTGADLTMAVSELLRLLRRHPLAAAGHRGRRPVLITAVPGSFNVLGPVLAAEQLAAMRMNVDCLFPEEPEEIAERLRRSEVSDVVVALDPVHAHSIETADLDAVVQGARSAVQDRELRVMLYGRQVADEPGITSRTHSDAAYATLAEMNGEALDPPSSA